jgi:DNA repair photolyase
VFIIRRDSRQTCAEVAGMHEAINSIRGRGTAENPANRFERIAYEPDPAGEDEESPSPATLFFRDTTRSIIAHNESPDVGFSASINPYRGCEHGCVYCYARPYHEYLGFSAGLDFETKIMVKDDAPELLRKEMISPRWQPETIGLSGVTDCYQPIERRLRLTRGCLEVLAEFRNPVSIVTKNHLVVRDIDLLQKLAARNGAAVYVSVTTLDRDLARRLEPRATQPEGRLAAIRELSAAGVPVGVLTAPIIPGLSDHEIPALLEAVAEAGARYAGYTVLRLPFGVATLFEQWLEKHFPERKDKVLGRIKEMHGGHANDSRFGVRMKGDGVMADAIKQMFTLGCRKAGLSKSWPKLSTAAFRRPGGPQMMLFDEMG